MPRLDHRAEWGQFPYELRLVLELLLEEINVLRHQAGLAPRTLAHVRVALRQYLRTHPRPPSGA